MHLRTSIILALSALSLGACISNPSSAPTSSSSSTPINPFAKDYSGLTLNQYGVASPCRTICTVCGFVALS